MSLGKRRFSKQTGKEIAFSVTTLTVYMIVVNEKKTKQVKS